MDIMNVKFYVKVNILQLFYFIYYLHYADKMFIESWLNICVAITLNKR